MYRDDYIPDEFDKFDQYEAEQARLQRMRAREARAFMAEEFKEEERILNDFIRD